MLNDLQKDMVRQWAAEGAGLSEIQRRIKEKFGISMTYMDVRFMMLDLHADVKDKPEPKAAEEGTGKREQGRGNREQGIGSRGQESVIRIQMLTVKPSNRQTVKPPRTTSPRKTATRPPAWKAETSPWNLTALSAPALSPVVP